MAPKLVAVVVAVSPRRATIGVWVAQCVLEGDDEGEGVADLRVRHGSHMTGVLSWFRNVALRQHSSPCIALCFFGAVSGFW